MAALKKGKVSAKPTVRKGGFDRSKLSANFMANAKKGKDDVQGWAFDFDNPE